MNEKTKKNIKTCNNILEELRGLSNPIRGRPDIFMLVDELTTKVKWLKSLYEQIIS